MRDFALLASRILLVAIFPISGYYKIVQWPAIAGLLERSGWPFANYLGMLGTAAEFVLPLLITLGLFTRYAALGLIVYVALATYLGHPIWRVPAEAYFAQLMSFMKNIAMIGGLLMLVVVGPGRLAILRSRDD